MMLAREEIVMVIFKLFNQLDLFGEFVLKSMPAHKFLDSVSHEIDFSFADRICEPFYSHLGQHAYAPSIMLRIKFIQTFYNFSDRELEEALRYNIAYKKFVGFPLDRFSFDHSSREDFDSRIPVEIHKAIFFHILNQLIDKGLVKSSEAWMVDSTHSLSRATRLSTNGLIRQGITQLMYAIRLTAKHWVNRVNQQLSIDEILDEKIHFKAAEEKKLQYFSRLIVIAYGVLAQVEKLLESKDHCLTEKHKQNIKEKADTLNQILIENIEIVPTETGKQKIDSGVALSNENQESTIKYRAMPKGKEIKNRIASAVDKDDRFGSKSNKKKYMGKKTQNIVTSESQLILNIEGIKATTADGEDFLPLIDEAIESTKIKPEKALVDTAYTTETNLLGGRERGIQIVGNIKNPMNKTGKYTTDKFTYDPDNKTITCVNGITVTKGYHNEKRKDSTTFHFSPEICKNCVFRPECTDSKNGREVTFSDHYKLIEETKKYNTTDEGKEYLKKRPRIERVQSVEKNCLGLNKIKSWGEIKYKIQGYWVGISYNISRCIKLIEYFPNKYQRALNTQPVCPK